jgi:hypothetical protein
MTADLKEEANFNMMAPPMHDQEHLLWMGANVYELKSLQWTQEQVDNTMTVLCIATLFYINI